MTIFFDLFSIIILVLLLIGLFVGFIKGIWKSLGGLIGVIISALAAVLTCNIVADLLAQAGLQNALSTTYFTWISDTISWASTELTGGEIEEFLPNLYESLNLPESIREIIDQYAQQYIPQGNDITALGLPLAESLADLTCLLLAFIIVFAGVFIVYLIIRGIISFFLPKRKPKLWSRILGMIIEFLKMAFVAVIFATILNLLTATGDNPISNFVVTTLDLNNPNSISLAKWLVQENWLLNLIAMLA